MDIRCTFFEALVGFVLILRLCGIGIDVMYLPHPHNLRNNLLIIILIQFSFMLILCSYFFLFFLFSLYYFCPNNRKEEVISKIVIQISFFNNLVPTTSLYLVHTYAFFHYGVDNSQIRSHADNKRKFVFVCFLQW